MLQSRFGLEQRCFGFLRPSPPEPACLRELPSPAGRGERPRSPLALSLPRHYIFLGRSSTPNLSGLPPAKALVEAKGGILLDAVSGEAFVTPWLCRWGAMRAAGQRRRFVMTRDKDLKRVVRSRMQKTGESYTAARLHVVKDKKDHAPAEPEYVALAGMTDNAVSAKTGRTWAEWVRFLDGLSAVSMTHREIVDRVAPELQNSSWWAQTVTVGYERIRGLREIGQKRGGEYEANKSRTFAISIDKLYAAFSNTRTRGRWLSGVKIRIRTAQQEKSMRITWMDDTHVDVYFTPKEADRCQVAIQHRKIATRAESDRLKKYWTERLDALGVILTRTGKR